MRQIITTHVRPISSLSTKVASGGILNAAAALAALSTLPPHEGLSASTDTTETNNNHGNNQSSNNASSTNPGLGQGNQGNSRVMPPRSTTPASRLPNLDELRRARPAAPRAPEPVPSKLRRCPRRNPNCDNTGNSHNGDLSVALAAPPSAAHPVADLPAPEQEPHHYLLAAAANKTHYGGGIAWLDDQRARSFGAISDGPDWSLLLPTLVQSTAAGSTQHLAKALASPVQPCAPCLSLCKAQMRRPSSRNQYPLPWRPGKATPSR